MGNFVETSFVETGAHFSPCGKYRYHLWRIWNQDKPLAAFIGLNPSMADATQDDPTIRRCIGYAKKWGFGGITVVNLFALMATYPKLLLRHPDPIGRENDTWIQQQTSNSGLNIICWGNHGTFLGRASAALHMVPNPHCLKINKSGQPSHPLYLPYSVEPSPYREGSKVS